MSLVEYFDNVVVNWNKMWSEYFKDEVREKILGKIDVKNKVIGDLGCGIGFILLGFVDKGVDIVFVID